MANTFSFEEASAPAPATFSFEEAIGPKRDLPAGVEPSKAGAGRGVINPPTVAEMGQDLSRPSFRTASPVSTRTSEPPAPKRQSVLEGVDLPEQPFDPAEADRLSRRDYAERALLPDDPRRAAPKMSQPRAFVAAAPEDRSATDLARDVAAGVAHVGISVASPYADVASMATGGAIGPGAREELNRAQRWVSTNIGSATARDEQRQLGLLLKDDNADPMDVVRYLAQHPVLLGDQAASALGSFVLPTNVVKVAKVLGVAMTPARATKIAMAVNDAMNAGQTFNDTDADLAGKYGAAAIAGLGSRAVGLATGGGTEGMIARRLGAGQKLEGLKDAVTSTLVKEPTQEFVENFSQQVGQDIGEGKSPDLNAATKQGALGALVAPFGTGPIAAANINQQAAQPPTAQEQARAKGFLVDETATAARIQRLKDAGEKDAAAVLEKRLNVQLAEKELRSLGDQPFYTPQFEQGYRTLRASGAKPAEAAAKAAIGSSFVQTAQQAQIPPKAVAAATAKAAGMPVSQIPGFLDRFVATLTAKGVGQPVAPGTVAPALEEAGHQALTTAADTLYAEKQQAVDRIADLVGAPAETTQGEQDATLRQPISVESRLQRSAGAGDEATSGQVGQGVAPVQEPAGSRQAGAVQGEVPRAQEEALSVDHGAHEAAVSPLNTKPEPTKAQILGGNAELGHTRIGPLDISIENPDGSTREDKHNEPPKWRTEMQGAHYGYLRGTLGADKDHVDVFVKAGTPTNWDGPVYVVDQVNPKTGHFDEHKVVLGADSEQEASDLYHRHYEDGWKGAKGITTFPSVAAFNEWVRDGRKNLPAAQSAQAQPAAPAEPAAPQNITGSPAVSLTLTRNPSGTLAVTGDPETIRKILNDAGVTRMMLAKTGMLVGKTEADKAAKVLAKYATKPAKGDAEPKPAQPLSLGMTPASAEPVTVKNGIVHIGKDQALNFDTGEPITVPHGATDAQIRQALKDGGAVSKRQHFYGGEAAQESRGPAASEAWRNEGKSAADLLADKVERLGADLAGNIFEESRLKDFAPSELPTAVRQWAEQEKVPADDLRQAVIKALGRYDFTEGRLRQIRSALAPEKSPSGKPEQAQASAKAEGEGRVAEKAAEAPEAEKPADLKPLDHGELSIPNRTKNIDRDLDRHKEQQRVEQVAKNKKAAEKRRDDKAKAKELFAKHIEAMLDRYDTRVDVSRKELRHVLDQMVKWEPAKFLTLTEKFLKEQEARAAEKPGEEPAFARGGISHEQRAENFRRWSNNAPLVTSDKADTYSFKSGQKVVLEAYHGAKRPDRIGTVFKRSRATSGPMAFFTSAPELASSYAQNKSDTSLANEDQHYATWFKYKPPGERTAVDIDRAWYRLSAEQQAKIAALAPRVTTDDTGEEIILGPESLTRGNGGYHVEATRTSWDRRGNPLKALVDAWLDSAALYNEEENFFKVLELAGFPVKDVTYDSPFAEYPSVYKVFVRMQSPLVTSDIPQKVVDALKDAAKRDRSRAAPGGSDMWDKNTRTLREWVSNFTDPANQSNAYVWTSIPDKVTEVFKSLGYDGIIDWSGKGGGHAHPVYIPFEETQVKSATGNKGTFDPMKKDILLALTPDEINAALRLFTTGRGGMSVEQAEKIVNDLTAKWKNGPEVKVVGTYRELPIDAPPDARGLYYEGKVWVVAGAHRDSPQIRQTVGQTLAHEAIAHYGLRQMLGKEAWTQFMRQINLALESGNKPLNAIRDQIRRLYVDERGNYILNPNTEADEIAAKVVENAIDANGEFKPGFSFVKAIYAKIADFLRSIGIDVKLTVPELHGMLVLAQKNLEVGKRTQGGGEVLVAAGRGEQGSLMRVFHGSPHEFDSFDSSKIGTGEGAQAYGHGLYFAGKREVAEYYKKTLSEQAKGVVINGERIMSGDKPLAQKNARERAAVFASMALRDGRTVADMARKIASDARIAEQEPSRLTAFQKEGGWGDAKTLRETADILKDWASRDVRPIEGKVYEVEIPDEGHYLLWDKPLSQQPEAVKESLRRLGVDPDGNALSNGSNLVKGYPLWDLIIKRAGFDPHSAEGRSAWLHSGGISGIKYLDGVSRHRSLNEIKREFLSELPEDADFNEVTDLIGTGTFSPANEAILKALAADDWLGFDYPAQAISAALGGKLSNFDASPELVKAVADAQDGGTYNYVLFDDKAAKIEAMFARGPIAGQTNRQYTPEQERAMKNVGFHVQPPTLKQRMAGVWQDAGKKLAQGLADQFMPVKELDQDAYALMRLSKGASGAFETLLRGGQLKLTGQNYDFDATKRGGVVDKLLIPLGGEHHDFFRWVAANRAEQLMNEWTVTFTDGSTRIVQGQIMAQAIARANPGAVAKATPREHLFTRQDIADLKSLANGTTTFDYKIQTGAQAGTVTRDRTLIYADALRVFNQFNKNVLDMAEQSGLIDGAGRSAWEKEFYVPFYRVADESEGGVRGMNIKSGVVRQQAFKQLKGGSQALNMDLLDNVLLNWAHLLDAAAKNRAAKATLEAAERAGIAIGAPQSTVKQIATSTGNKNGIVWFMDGGVKRHFVVDDPYILTAINGLEYAGMRGPVMDAMGAFKRYLTMGVTASPYFKVRNLIRDSVQAIGTGPISYNPAKNIAQGWKLTNPESDQFFRLLAGGGTIHFGTMLEGSEAKRVQALVESGIEDATILNNQGKVKALYRRFLEPAITAYNELGNRGEAINRAALYDQLIKQGVNHTEASLMARDLMDFSMQGSFATVRFLTQVVPFMNARIQGLYKLGRAAKDDPTRFAIVIGATALTSLMLWAKYRDDDDWKKREDWDRNTYFWFKIAGKAYRIPKPFEIGAIATLAERGAELWFDKEMDGKRFGQQVRQILSDQLSMNPIPQMVKPILDVYANQDSFTGRPIETAGMEKLQPEYRFTDQTSMTARAISTGMNKATQLVGVDALSPVQVDQLIRGYFGWLGSFVIGAADVIARPLMGEPKHPTPDYWKAATGGMVSDLKDAPSRYVSQMYKQAREVEQAYGTYHELYKQGRIEQADAFLDKNMDVLGQHKRVEAMKRAQSELNAQQRQIERDKDLTPDQKREQIREVLQLKDVMARP